MNNHLEIELLEIVLLGGASMIFLTTALRAPNSGRLWSLMLAMACLAGAFRELEPDLFDHPTFIFINLIGRKVLYRVAIASAIGLLIAALIRDLGGLKQILSPAIIGIWIGAIGLMAIGSIFEKQGAIMIEELFELAGESLVMLSALLHRKALLACKR